MNVESEVTLRSMDELLAQFEPLASREAMAAIEAAFSQGWELGFGHRYMVPDEDSKAMEWCFAWRHADPSEERRRALLAILETGFPPWHHVRNETFTIPALFLVHREVKRPWKAR